MSGAETLTRRCIVRHGRAIRVDSAIAHLDRERIDAPPQFVPHPLIKCLVL